MWRAIAMDGGAGRGGTAQQFDVASVKLSVPSKAANPRVAQMQGKAQTGY